MDRVFKYSGLCLVYDEKCLLRGTDWVFKYSGLGLVYDEKCLLHGTNWVFKYSSLRLVYDEKYLQCGTDWAFKYSGLRFVRVKVYSDMITLFLCRMAGDYVPEFQYIGFFFPWLHLILVREMNASVCSSYYMIIILLL
jgi:hypothetical protein